MVYGTARDHPNSLPTKYRSKEPQKFTADVTVPTLPKKAANKGYSVRNNYSR